MNFIYEKITYLFDPLHHIWEHERIHRKISLFLVIFFLAWLTAIELNRSDFFPLMLSRLIPTNHFSAIAAAFTVVLILEVISLIFTLPCSFSRSVGTQFELLALILMRDSFKQLAYLPEPINLLGEQNQHVVQRILSDGFGALLIFTLLGVYYLVQEKKTDETMRPLDLFSFVSAKKGIALLLLVIFGYMGINSAAKTILGLDHSDFLHDFYTLLILADILVVLISQCFQPGFYAVFRNSGFALSTVIIRIALAAPPFFNVLLGISAALFAITLTIVCNKLFKHVKHTYH